MQKSLQIFAVTALFFLLSGCNKNTIEMQGYIEGKYTYVTAAVSGALTQIFVQRGTPVKTGTQLFILDQQPEAAQLDEAKQKLAQAQQVLQDQQKGSRNTVIAAIEAQKEQAQASLNLATITLHRYQKLLSVGAIDKASVDQVEANYKAESKRVSEINANLAEAKLGARENAIKAQQAAVDAAQATVKQVNWTIEQKTQSAPVDAIVFDTLFRTGEWVAAGQPVISMLAPKDTKLVFFLSEKYLSLTKLGDNVAFTCDGCKQSYTAKISFISPEAEYTPPVIYSEASREKLVYRIEAELDLQAATALHPGQPVQVFIQLKK